jgi:hypothetical protein
MQAQAMLARLLTEREHRRPASGDVHREHRGRKAAG